MRTEQFKLIRFYYDVDAWELFDLEKDPNEMNNVYDDPNYKGIREKMHIKLEEVRKKYKDSNENNNRFLDEYLKARN